MQREQTAESLFSIRPEPARGGSCPRCHEPLVVVRLRFPGWRSLLEGDCPTCGHRYLKDLPAGHGLVYPTTLDLDTGETFDPGHATWFSSLLKPTWEAPDDGPVRFAVTVHQARPAVVFLNCLDPVYGHAVLKLFNAQRELERAEDLGCIVLAPASLMSLIPDGMAEVWLVDEPPSRFNGWLLELEERLASELERFDQCLLSPAYPHPHPSTYDLERFIGQVEPERIGEPSIVLSLRDDRLWGKDDRAQRRHVAGFLGRIRSSYPRAGFAAVGVGGQAALPAGVEDLRSQSPDVELERRWLALLRGADLVLGVHGSNMLLPSGLTKATVELLPERRYGNVFQDTLVTQQDPILALFRHRTVYGDAALRDVSAERVAEVTVSLLAELDRFDTLMTGPAAGESAAAVPHVVVATPAQEEPAGPSLRARFRDAGWAGTARRGAEALRAGRRAGREHLRKRELKRRARSERLPVVLTDERGTRFELVTEDEVEAFLQHGGHFEREAMRIGSALLEPGMTAVDVGANIGAFAAGFALAVGSSGHVHAFEPLGSARRRLMRTLELNSLENVTVSPAALSDQVGQSKLYSYGPGFESWSTLAPRTIEQADRTVEAAASQVVETTTLDDYCASAGISRIDVLKIDAEGAEQRVLRGASRLLEQERVRAVIVEVSDNTLEAFGDRAYRLLEFLEAHGLRPYLIEAGSLRPLRIAGKHRWLTNVLALSAEARKDLDR